MKPVACQCIHDFPLLAPHSLPAYDWERFRYVGRDLRDRRACGHHSNADRNRPSVKVKIPWDKPGFQRRIRFGELCSCNCRPAGVKPNGNDCIRKSYPTRCELERRDAASPFAGMALLSSRSVVVPNRRV